MFRLVVLENLLTINYSKTLKPNLVGAPYKRKDCNSFYYALILIGLLLRYSYRNYCIFHLKENFSFHVVAYPVFHLTQCISIDC